jgi:hypothetical protein
MNMVERMTRQEIEKWALQESETDLLTPEETNHVIDCLESLMRWYWNDEPVGDFLEAVLRNDFSDACSRADGTNRKVLSLYDKFLYNCIPADFRVKVKKYFGE